MPQVILVEEILYEHHARYRAFDLNGTGVVLLGFACDIFGWQLRNPSGSTAAVMDIYDGGDASGTVALPFNLPSNGNTEAWFGPNGIRFENGVYANVTAGEVKGSIFYRHVRK